MTIKDMLAQADIHVNGSRAWDIQVKEENLDLLFKDMLSLGETYMQGVWTSEDLEATLMRLTKSRRFHRILAKSYFNSKKNQPINLKDKEKSQEVIDSHYDLGNDLFRAMLDPSMTYTCGYWKNADNLEDAQRAKHEMICRKLELHPGMRVLDLGCGFGAFMKYATENYGVECTGYTLSENQAKIARKYGTVHVKDYRDATGKFDRILSLGLLEHITYVGYRDYFKTVNKCLLPEGISLFQTIGHHVSHKVNNPWINKYIFPNGMLPSLTQLSEAMERLFVMEDLHNFGLDYAKTCRAWFDNFSDNWPDIKDKYGEEFYRMWEFYLVLSIVGFRNRELQLYQCVITKQRTRHPKRYSD